MQYSCRFFYLSLGRIAHAVRGLKYRWIYADDCKYGRIAHAVHGLKLGQDEAGNLLNRRIAHAVRGLKSLPLFLLSFVFPSHRSRGAWIEICTDSRLLR